MAAYYTGFRMASVRYEKLLGLTKNCYFSTRLQTLYATCSQADLGAAEYNTRICAASGEGIINVQWGPLPSVQRDCRWLQSFSAEW